MAKQVACDKCGRTAPLGFLDTLPAGWLMLTERTPVGEDDRTTTFCGFGCVADFAEAERAQRAAVQLRESFGPALAAANGPRVVPPLADVGGFLDKAADAVAGMEPEPAPVVPAGWRPAGWLERAAGELREDAHVRVAQADSSDEGGGYVGPGE